MLKAMETERSIKERLKTETQKSVLSSIQNGIGSTLKKVTGRQWREKQIRKIADKVFDNVLERLDSDRNKPHLTLEELHVAVLLVYNDINKFFPGRHIDPPPKEKVKEMKERCDKNSDGVISRDEFVDFIMQFASDALIVVSKGLVMTLILGPTIAMASRATAEGAPGIGRAVQKLPNSMYALLVTLELGLVQKLYQWT